MVAAGAVQSALGHGDPEAKWCCAVGAIGLQYLSSQASVDPRNVNDEGKKNSHLAYTAVMERIASISTLHQNFSAVLEEENLYDKEIDEYTKLCDEDIRQPSFQVQALGLDFPILSICVAWCRASTA